MKIFFPLLLTAVIFASGCIYAADYKPLQPIGPDRTTTTYAPQTTYQPTTTAAPTTTQVIDNYPTITSSLNPSNPSALQFFNLTISATDDKGLVRISWQSSKPFSNLGQSGYFDCNAQTACSNTWQLNASEQGVYQITAVAIDSTGKNTESNLEVNVGPAPTTSSTTTSSTTTTTIPPTTTTAGCTSNSACGYKQICSSGKCVDVDCTNDGQCSGCKKCSGNRCVSCGYGPYGCYC